MKINDWPNVWFRWVYIPSNLARVLPQRLGKMEKKVFPAYFRHFWTEKFFFQKSGSVTFWALPFSTFVPKIRKKTNEPISRKAGNRRTDEHTNGERLIYRTSKVGPKKQFITTIYQLHTQHSKSLSMITHLDLFSLPDEWPSTPKRIVQQQTVKFWRKAV